MDSRTIIHDHLQQNRLREAIESAQAQLRSNPVDANLRSLLGLLYCLDGQVGKADRHMATVAQQSADFQVGVSLIRQLLRAEAARQDFFLKGGVPELMSEPDLAVENLLRAIVAEREGDYETVQTQVQSLKDTLPQLNGMVNGKRFESVCDLDDFLSHFLEILSLNGKFYLIPFQEISTLSFHQPEKLQDQIWRSADLSLVNGFQGVVYVPTCYSKGPSDTRLRDALKLGHETDWISRGEGAPVRGVGQKTLLFGETPLTIMELDQLEFKDK